MQVIMCVKCYYFRVMLTLLHVEFCRLIFHSAEVTFTMFYSFEELRQHKGTCD